MPHSVILSREVMMVSSIIPAGLWLLGEVKAVLQLLWGDIALENWTGIHFSVEILCLLIPTLWCTTMASSTIAVVASIVVTSLYCNVILGVYTRDALRKEDSSADWLPKYFRKLTDLWKRDRAAALLGPRKDFISNYRASIMAMTCITILAVDFKVFPRRFAKTEVYGTGLMDLGVGVTLFASGVSRGCKDASVQGMLPWQPRPRALLPELLSCARWSWPLLALGISRLVAIKALNYQEHVSEYGIHWNFFATIFCVRMLAVVSRLICPLRLRVPVAFACLCVYQWLLCEQGLTDFVVHSPRDSFFSKNREGILGLLGFATTYLVGEAMGRSLALQPSTEEHEEQVNHLSRVCVTRLSGAAFALWALTLLSRSFVQDTSRRLVNLTYVLWVCAYSVLVLLLLLLVDLFCTRPPRSKLLSAVNSNMFMVFVVANLLTGGINLCMRTLDANDSTAMVVLFTYSVGVMVIASVVAR
ncbi:unnamed protein product [Choristocarpus tenellus]